MYEHRGNSLSLMEGVWLYGIDYTDYSTLFKLKKIKTEVANNFVNMEYLIQPKKCVKGSTQISTLQ